MAPIYVQFADSTEEVIVSVFGCPQAGEEFPNQGEVQESDGRYAAFYKSLPGRATQGLPDPAPQKSSVASNGTGDKSTATISATQGNSR
ncbi:hypothetical protein [Burkholderia lata]|uniref:hypothetical protein n=1 Tax=Burkholderia lata (strain ATCC 17760 / DSM 23089 / LMG 22485 / NCIMB 9086 / R18194 / 383) TaxID=482957 RepID=UPI0013DE6089|nr:hypothetical protein [Burkholderia lata]